MIGWLNIGSLVLGLIAWTLPIITLTSYKKFDRKNWFTVSVMSLSACAISLFFKMKYNSHLGNTRAWTAIMYTTSVR